ncbi:hypothetical protein [Lutispora saccharofermentans]|uniref:Uncharacterized protein n=1 Tax=Lutispora saccharofermentans TaxID=3024236 RepID=A0ABT1NG47_9FIRM|nr:hypothetical protein [Lutispora saccharofermentans]MCQ1529296.1 hypothetical protein [Lutispora saccharofermentans]
MHYFALRGKNAGGFVQYAKQFKDDTAQLCDNILRAVLGIVGIDMIDGVALGNGDFIRGEIIHNIAGWATSALQIKGRPPIRHRGRIGGLRKITIAGYSLLLDKHEG